MDPLHQFQIQRYLPINIGGLDASFSNSALYMVITVALITGLIVYGMRGRALVPTRMQSLAELFYEFVANLVRDNAGPDARKYFPFVFSLFMFIMIGNLLGLIPGTFTFTSHIIVTFGLALTVFVFVTLLGLIKHGFHFFSLFIPHGTPMLMIPFIFLVELLSFLVRPGFLLAAVAPCRPPPSGASQPARPSTPPRIRRMLGVAIPAGDCRG